MTTPLAFADYAAGRDPALEAAIGYEAPPRLYELVGASRDVAGVRDVVRRFVADPRNRYANLQLQMLISAEQLASSKRFDEAVVMAELAASRFPGSAEPHLAHAFVAERAGRLAEAAEAARRAMAIDPNSRQARSLLERVEMALAKGGR